MEILFRHVLESECEVIVIYDNGKYYGYIDMEYPLNIMISEYKREFVPLTLKFSEDIIEEAYAQFNQCKSLTLIPLDLVYKDDVMVFICNKPATEQNALYEAALYVLDTYDGNERTKKFFISQLLNDKEGIVLSELDEFTFKCYKVLKKEAVKIWCEGYLWKLVGIEADYSELVPEKRIIFLKPLYVVEIGAVAYEQEFVYMTNMLYAKGIDAYVCLIPKIEKIGELNALEEIMNKELITFPKVAANHSTKVENFFLKKFLDIEDNEEISEVPGYELIYPKVLGKGEATIYLIGPCIVEGSTCPESVSLANILYQKCVESSLDYKVCRIVIQGSRMDVQQVVEELDITDADKVFFICSASVNDGMKRCIDMLPIYNERKADELFFTDSPIHTLRAGNEAIAECMISYISKGKKIEGRKEYLQVGRPQLSFQEKNEILSYVAKIQGNPQLRDGSIGAIVMNANPFTSGHLYLIEKAAKQVAFLYLFVVQEDLSEFRFEDRFRLVKEGTAHLENVSVVPSGGFVLSKRTMSAYFEKETLQESRVDASKDVAIFGSYIAPELSIDVRFVGEEPFDSVTRQYNEEMKKKLPLYGIKVVEIPRVGVEENIISASVVRGLYQEQKWTEIEKLVPDSTYQFLKSRPIMRDKENISNKKSANREVEKRREFFKRYDKVVFYPAGKDGKQKYEKLSDQEKKKVYFADIKALYGKYKIEGRGQNVMSPEELNGEFKDAPIIITSTRYQSEICRYLFEMGVDLDRMNLLC